MREILFRGKRTDNGEWVEGYYIKATHHWNEKGIHEDWIAVDTIQNGGWCNVRGKHAIIPETVGQYTGLIVPSGKIFEHDIVTAKFKSNGSRHNFVVEYDDKNGCFVFNNGTVKVPFERIRSIMIKGNIHDNHELLGGDKK